MSCRRNGCKYYFCSSDDECPCHEHYVRGPGSLGVYAFEQLTFQTLDDGKIIVPEALFGCGREIDQGHIPSDQSNGVFGLAGGETTHLMNQLGSQFSYCIGNMMDPHYSHNQLFLGEGAKIEGYSTPLESIDQHYYVTLEGVSVEGEMLDIDPTIFEKTPGVTSGVIMDSGSPFTRLVQDAYDVLREEIESLYKEVLRRNNTMGLLCYIGSEAEDLGGFPAVTFHFAHGVELVLDTQSMFLQMQPKLFCISVGRSTANGNMSKDLSIIGMMAQQNYNVGYDISENKLYFQRIDCELIED